MRVPSFSPLTLLIDSARYVYIGEVGTNPMTSPISLFYDAGHTRKAPNPFPLLNGFNSLRGAQSALFAKESVAITVTDSDDVVLYTIDNASMWEATQLVDALLTLISAILVLKAGDVMTGPLEIPDAVGPDDLYSRAQLDAMLDSMSVATFMIESDADLILFLQHDPLYDFRFTFVKPGVTAIVDWSVVSGSVLLAATIPPTCIRLWSESFNPGKLDIKANTSRSGSGNNVVLTNTPHYLEADITIENIVLFLRFAEVANTNVAPNAIYLLRATIKSCQVKLFLPEPTIVSAFTFLATVIVGANVFNVRCIVECPSTYAVAPITETRIVGVANSASGWSQVCDVNLDVIIPQTPSVTAHHFSICNGATSVAAAPRYLRISRDSEVDLSGGKTLGSAIIVDIDGTVVTDSRKSNLLYAAFPVYLSFNGNVEIVGVARKAMSILRKLGTTSYVYFRGVQNSIKGLIQGNLALSFQGSLSNGRIENSNKVDNSTIKALSTVAQVAVAVAGTASKLYTNGLGLWMALIGTTTSRVSSDNGATWGSLPVSAITPLDAFIIKKKLAFIWNATNSQYAKEALVGAPGWNAWTSLPALANNIVGMFATRFGKVFGVTTKKVYSTDLATWTDIDVAFTMDGDCVAVVATGDNTVMLITTTKVYLSTNISDSVVSFVEMSNVPAGTFVSCVRGPNKTWFYLTTTNLYISYNNGATWAVFYAAPVNTTFSAVDLDESATGGIGGASVFGGTIIVVGQVTGPTLFVARTVNFGTSWTVITPAGVTAFDVKTDGCGNWFVSATNSTPTILVGKSTDDGATFTWTATAACVAGRNIVTDGKGVWLHGTNSANIVRQVLASYTGAYFSSDASVAAANTAVGGWNN